MLQLESIPYPNFAQTEMVVRLTHGDANPKIQISCSKTKLLVPGFGIQEFESGIPKQAGMQALKIPNLKAKFRVTAASWKNALQSQQSKARNSKTRIPNLFSIANPKTRSGVA